jgi:hypothetical protein
MSAPFKIANPAPEICRWCCEALGESDRPEIDRYFCKPACARSFAWWLARRGGGGPEFIEANARARGLRLRRVSVAQIGGAA